MLLFFSQIENPTKEDNQQFIKLKKSMGKCFKELKKQNDKDRKSKTIMKSGQNWIAIHQFSQ